jgi:hypothetical protein
MKKIVMLAIVCCAASAFGQGCKSIVVKNNSDKVAKAWNCAQRDAACTATKDMPELGAKKGDHYVCSRGIVGKDTPPPPISGYHVVYTTSGCSECAVGWLYFTGEKCGPSDLNCMD